MKVFQLFKEIEKVEEELPDKVAHSTISDPRYLAMPRCSACNKVIHPRDYGAVAFRCPNCGKGIIIRDSKCRKMANIARCPVCGYEYP